MKTTTIALTIAFTGYIFISQSQNKTEMLLASQQVNSNALNSNTTIGESPLVDFDAYAELVTIVKDHRKSHLISLNTFKEMSEQENTLILDTRSEAMYKRKHVKGAIHLNFSDFTQQNLADLIPNAKTRVLIYCNNNFEKDQVNFASKMVMPKILNPDEKSQGSTNEVKNKSLTLALNIPTYINLYGYGYKNVYELSELISVFDSRISFEGTDVK
jgi:hypothetical protein